MYDSFKVRSDDEMKHLRQSNWRIISQKGNMCVRTYTLDKTKILDDGRKVTSQAFIFYQKHKPAFVLQIWPLHKPLVYRDVLIAQRRKKLGIKFND